MRQAVGGARRACFAYDEAASLVSVNLIPKCSNRNTKTFGRTSTVSSMGEQCFANKLSLDLRNGVTDEFSNDTDLSFGEV
jgi:hypothetical protein